uniref:Integrase core domain containing protein n=1 Tax=Solanum tuberosum TaxID=4113 RepID=M1DM55_SOLTU
MKNPPSVEPRKWTTIRRSIYRPFCTSMVPIRAQLFGTSDLRRGPPDCAIAPKRTPTYVPRGKSKSEAPTLRLIYQDTNTKTDLVYVTPTMRTSTTAPRTTWNQNRQMVPDVVTASQSDGEDTLIDSSAGSAACSKSFSASGSSSGSASGSSSHARTASSDNTNSEEYIPVPSSIDTATILE